MTSDSSSEQPSQERFLIDDEEAECRVCRGPAEEGRPLFAPCRCSGSIGRVHQDCLKSWLAVRRGTKCELCSTPFLFTPKYADGAPDRLPPHEVVAGILQRAAGKWLPFILRACVAITLWLFVIPLVTAYLYYGWLHRPSSIIPRLKLELLANDAVSGGVVAAVIILSFLSLMSFADFLRFHWQRNDQAQGNGNAAVIPAAAQFVNMDNEDIDAFPTPPVINYLAEGVERLPRIGGDGGDGGDEDSEAVFPHNLDNSNFFPIAELDAGVQNNGGVPHNDARRLVGGLHADGEPIGELIGELNQGPDNLNNLLLEVEREIPVERHPGERNPGERNPGERNPGERHAGPLAAQFIENNNRFQPRVELRDPGVDIEDAMDIHVAMDELLGFRGPITAVIRNMMWLLAFHTTYLGLFAFIPHTVGQTVHTLISKTGLMRFVSLGLSRVDAGYFTKFGEIISSLNAESQRLSTILQLSDLLTIGLGYFSMALLIFFWKTVALGTLCILQLDTNVESDLNGRRNEEGAGDPHFEQNDMDENFEARENRATFAHQFQVALECAAAIVKVGILLFLKMLLLPLLLGIWLDASTLSLYDRTVEDRVLFAGSDLFGSMLLHWVVGITFMLLVTVSVLQLREVVHPNILAKVIRPQEPQADFLGNLLKESGSTHAKRMFLSLGIYVALLTINISVPAMAIASTGLGKYLPFFRPQIHNFFLPQLQMPVELLIFHLSMLAFLEKYKNYIGTMWHHFLVVICDKMQIATHLLPHTVDKFVLVGTRSVFKKVATSGHENSTLSEIEGVDKNDKETVPLQDCYEVDPFWSELLLLQHPDEFITSNVDPSEDLIYDSGVMKRDGKRVLAPSYSKIRLSPSLTIPTSIDSYRLRRRVWHLTTTKRPYEESLDIEFWKEIIGQPISRPPDGWDDLGVGGAEVQGCWAYGDEKRSLVEEGVAARVPFSQCKNTVLLSIKLFFLVILCWLSYLIVGCTSMNVVLLLGRCVFIMLQVPVEWIHDPVVFALGMLITFLVAGMIPQRLKNEGLLSCFKGVRVWLSTFRLPKSIPKIRIVLLSLTLWLLVCPINLGLLYSLCLLTPSKFWSGNEPIALFTLLIKSWTTGSLLLHLWAVLCYIGLFTKEFWSGIGVALNGGEGGNNERPLERNDGNGNQEAVNLVHETEMKERRIWQGKDGRIAVFCDVLSRSLLYWEWDKVDRSALLQETTVPITCQLCLSLGLPFLLFILIDVTIRTYFSTLTSTGIVLPILGLVDYGYYRMIVFQFSAVCVVISQLANAFQSPLKHWFEAAHKAARDNRYLVGEALLDFLPTKKDPTNND